MTTSIWSIIVVNITNVCAALGSCYLKQSADSIKLSFKSLLGNKNLVKGVLLYITSTVLFIPALKYGDLSVLYPFVALSYIWTVLFSIKFLKEKVNGLTWIGVVLIMGGVIFIGLGSG